jgi:hypothetical protein
MPSVPVTSPSPSSAAPLVRFKQLDRKTHHGHLDEQWKPCRKTSRDQIRTDPICCRVVSHNGVFIARVNRPVSSVRDRTTNRNLEPML